MFSGETPSTTASADPGYEGHVENGSRQGSFRFFFRTGHVMAECTYLDGTKHGGFRFFFPSGSEERCGSYSDGKLSGEIRYFHENGTIIQTRNYEDGKLHGPFKGYYENGSIKWEEEYLHGQLNGRRICYAKNGQILKEEGYNFGRKNGEARIYSENGQLITREYFEGGQLEGPREQFYEDGTPYIKSEYVRGKLHGTVERFNERGELVESVIFRRGQMMKIAPIEEKTLEKPKLKPKKKVISDPRLIMEHPADLALTAKSMGGLTWHLAWRIARFAFCFAVLPGYLLYWVGSSLVADAKDKTKERIKIAMGEIGADAEADGGPARATAPELIAVSIAGTEAPKSRAPGAIAIGEARPAQTSAKGPVAAVNVAPMMGNGNTNTNSKGDRLARVLEGQTASNVKMANVGGEAPRLAVAARPAGGPVRAPQIQAAAAPVPQIASNAPAAPPRAVEQAGAGQLFPSRPDSNPSAIAAKQLDSGQLHEAVRALKGVLASDPSNAEAHFMIGISLARLDRANESLDYLAKAIASKPDYDLAHAAHGALMLKQGNDAGAIESISRALALNPLLSESRCLLGVSYLRSGRKAEATKEFEAAIRANQQNALAWAALAMIHYSENRLELAVREYERALNSDPRQAGLKLWDIYAGGSTSWDRASAADIFRSLLVIEKEQARALDYLTVSNLPAPCRDTECEN